MRAWYADDVFLRGRDDSNADVQCNGNGLFALSLQSCDEPDDESDIGSNDESDIGADHQSYIGPHHGPRSEHTGSSV